MPPSTGGFGERRVLGAGEGLEPTSYSGRRSCVEAKSGGGEGLDPVLELGRGSVEGSSRRSGGLEPAFDLEGSGCVEGRLSAVGRGVSSVTVVCSGVVSRTSSLATPSAQSDSGTATGDSGISTLLLVASAMPPLWCNLTGGEDCGIRDGSVFDDAELRSRSSLLSRDDDIAALLATRLRGRSAPMERLDEYASSCRSACSRFRLAR